MGSNDLQAENAARVISEQTPEATEGASLKGTSLSPSNEQDIQQDTTLGQHLEERMESLSKSLLKNAPSSELEATQLERSGIGVAGSLMDEIEVSPEALGVEQRPEASTSFSYAREKAEALRSEFMGSFLGIVRDFDMKFPVEISLSSEQLSQELGEAFIDGTALSIIESGMKGLPGKLPEERFRDAVENFVKSSGLGEEVPISSVERAFHYAREVATSRALLDKALLAGVSGASIPELAEIGNESRERLRQTGIGKFEQTQLIELFRYSTSAGMELPPLMEEFSGPTPGLIKLMREAGTHARDLPHYHQILSSAFDGLDQSKAQSWLPDGKNFEAINDQRAKVGNPRL